MPESQFDAVASYLDGPVLVLAGPGSGKTHLLAARAANLLSRGVSKDQITLLAFGRDASENMRRRLLDPRAGFALPVKSLPRISTMHSLGMQIVLSNAGRVGLRKASLQVQADDDVRKLLYRDAALLLGLTKVDAESAERCKTRGDCRLDADRNECQICECYRELMSKCDRIDFDDMVLFACQILERHSDVLADYQNAASHLLVDEYQDINAAQFRLIELLSRSSPAGLFAVGDDAQSIFSFRGGDPKFIKRFAADFPGAWTPPLPYSRRCPREIMADAFKVLETFYPEWDGPPDLEYKKEGCNPAQIWRAANEKREAEIVAQLAKDSIPGKTVLILAPKEEFFPLISKTLSDNKVPHEQTLDLLPARMRTVKRCIDWLREPHDNFAARTLIEELINTGIAKVRGAQKRKNLKEETIRERTAAETEVAKLWEHVDRTHSLFSVITEGEISGGVVGRVREGLERVLQSYNGGKSVAEGEFVRDVCVVTGAWKDPNQLCRDMSQVVELLGTQRSLGPGSVELKTMHKAKGLEADVVIIVGLENGIVPSPYASSGDQLAEEARRFYVSMTRSCSDLVLLHAWKRPRNVSYGEEVTQKPRSRFLDAIGRRSKWLG